MTIYVECKTDATLVNVLLGTATAIAHEKGKPGVCRRLQGAKDSMGMVDEDPAQMQVPYLRRLKVKQDLPRFGLRLLFDKLTGNHVIVLRPRLEEWMLRAALEFGLNAGKYGLPASASTFHRDINISQTEFRRLVRDLKNSERMRSLRSLLRGEA